MIYLYKYNGKKCCYDTSSGAVLELTALQYKMVGAIEAPMTPTCPTSLRYELAKYDSEDVTEAYNELYGFFSDGLIFGNDSDTAWLRICGEHAVTDAEEADLVLTFAKNSGMTKFQLSSEADYPDTFSTIVQKYELTNQ